MPEISAELEAAIVEIKRRHGVDTMTAGEIAPHLPEHLRQPFWRDAVERYLREQLGDQYEEVTGRGQ